MKQLELDHRLGRICFYRWTKNGYLSLTTQDEISTAQGIVNAFDSGIRLKVIYDPATERTDAVLEGRSQALEYAEHLLHEAGHRLEG